VLRADGLRLFGGGVRLLLVSLRERFFDESSEDFVREVGERAEAPCRVLSLNECQSVLFYQDENENAGMAALIRAVLVRHGVENGCLVCGGVVCGEETYAERFAAMEQMAD